GDAGQRHVVLDQRAAEQLGEGDRDLPVDHAVDVQLPAGRVDLGEHDRRVDPVEAGVRGDVRGQVRDVQVAPGRQRRRRVGRLGDLYGGAGRGDALAGVQLAAGERGHRGR